MLQNNLGQAQRFKKRERTQNWAYEEKHFLLELCRKDMHIIENKRLDSALTSLKNRAWKIIHQQFAIAFGTDRNCNRLKEQWRRMKACTRAEMLDYQQRIQRYGQEVADRKKPSQFTFEIWEFMQEAKKVCKNELMDDVDYSKMKLSLEENLPQGVSIKDCSDENDDESSSMWEKNSQNICEVQIKEDSADEVDDYEKGHTLAKYPRLRSLPSSSPFGVAETAQTRFNELLATSLASRLSEHHLVGAGGGGGGGGSNNNNSPNSKLLESLDIYNRNFGSETSLPDMQHDLSQTDLSSTLEALNILKSRFNRLNELGRWKSAFQDVHNLSTNDSQGTSTSNSSNSVGNTAGSVGSNNGGNTGKTNCNNNSSTNNNINNNSGNSSGCSNSGGGGGSGGGGAGTINSNDRTQHHLLAPVTPPPLLAAIADVADSPHAPPPLPSLQSESHREREHELRMEILKTDLETAKLNKETAEINRQIALQKLTGLNS